MRSVTVKVHHLHKPKQKHRTMTFAAFPDSISSDYGVDEFPFIPHVCIFIGC